jgi:hypothetical protein
MQVDPRPIGQSHVGFDGLKLVVLVFLSEGTIQWVIAIIMI